MSMSRDDDRGEPLSDEPAAILLRRARRLARNGEHRKAALALRERAALSDDAATWGMAGARWARARRSEDALAALRHGMWLHQKAGSPARARVVARIIRELDPNTTFKLAS